MAALSATGGLCGMGNGAILCGPGVPPGVAGHRERPGTALPIQPSCPARPIPAGADAAASWRLGHLYAETGDLLRAFWVLQRMGESYPRHPLAASALERSRQLLALLP